jgi:RNA polymerase sigma factor (TIGR02999 family)
VRKDRPENLTQSLLRWNAGDLSVEKELMKTIYPILRSLAQDQLSRSGPITMQATELANEAFIKLRLNGAEYINTQHQFMSFIARVLRNLIVDHVRLRTANKRGGNLERVQIAELMNLPSEEGVMSEIDWIALDAALVALEQEDAMYARLVELRYFLGYSIEQSAAQLDVSIATANRMWRFSRVFLSEYMHPIGLEKQA